MPLLTDVTPLREHPAFRRLWLGTMLSRTGSAMTSFAITLQVYDLTRSPAAVGGLGVAMFVPLLLITLPGGTFADRVDRRRLVLAVAAGQTVVSAVLFVLTAFGGASLWSLYALVTIGAAFSAVSAPAQQTFIPRLVPKEQLGTAMALNRIVVQVMLIVGPALAGVVTAWTGLRGCYLADVASFAGALWSVARLPAMPPVRPAAGEDSSAGGSAAGDGGRPRSGLALTLDGLAFIRRTPALCGAFLADVNATFFALPVSLFPAINAQRFGGSPTTLGLFTTAVGVGGLVSAVCAGPLKHGTRHGLVMLACVAVWGGAFALFAVAPSLWLTLLALAIAGLADTFTVVLRGIIVQEATPDEFRGRVNAADFLVGAGGSQLGSLEAGLVGSWTTPVISALSGGLLTVFGVLAIGAAMPGFRRYQSPTPAPEPSAVTAAPLLHHPLPLPSPLRRQLRSRNHLGDSGSMRSPLTVPGRIVDHARKLSCIGIRDGRRQCHATFLSRGMALPENAALVRDNRDGSGGDLLASADGTSWLLILPASGLFTVGFTVMSTHFRVTYATLSADNEELHTAYEAGLRLASSWLGADIHGYVSGEPRAGGELLTVTSPCDLSLTLCRVHSATPADVGDAVRAASAAAGRWARTPWPQRVAVLRAAADLISERSNELAALMSLEVGKNRLEALGDVEEAADLIRYYCQQVEDSDGFTATMGTLNPREKNVSVLRPYGVWAVISPFNFPMALAAGPAGAALATGNTVILKPSPQGSFTAVKLYECFRDAGLDPDVFHLLPGGDDVGAALVAHPGVSGLTFTGSYAVGMSIYRQFAGAYPKPVICEMGGKNPAIVSARADLDVAAGGVARSAFGLSGQKCSACSRVYAQRDVLEEFVAKLAERAGSLVVGDPTSRGAFLGPVINAESVERFERAVEHARSAGDVVTGGAVLRGAGALPDGYYLAPTVVTGLPDDDWIFRDELFVPLVAVAPYDTLDEALALANDTDLGLTAGFFSADSGEVDRFLDEIQAGVVYVNRAAGATTGAWPGVQPFGGWKGSGTGGKAGGGLYYVQQYLREQSRTVVS